MSPAWRFCIPCAIAIAFLSCASPPKTATEKPKDQGSNAQPGNQSQKEFVVTKELYDKTFDEVRDVIASLTSIIAARDYDSWLSYLTQDYVTRTSDPDFLANASNSGVLQKSGIVLHTLRDYFDNVVVRSRVQATLTEINFVDATHVKALTVFDGRPVILYYLVREGGRWKIGIWQTDHT